MKLNLLYGVVKIHPKTISMMKLKEKNVRDMVLRKVKSVRKCVTMVYIVVIVCAGMSVWIKKNLKTLYINFLKKSN